MRYSQAERMDIIRLVEAADQPVKRTLEELGLPHSTFYRWYQRYQEAGYDGLADRNRGHGKSGTAFRMRCDSRSSIELYLHYRANISRLADFPNFYPPPYSM